MLSPKEAIQVAREYLIGLYDEPLNNLRLEELEQLDGSSLYNVVFGFDVEAPEYSPAAARADIMGIPRLERIYKQVLVDGETGQPKSMSIRVV